MQRTIIFALMTIIIFNQTFALSLEPQTTQYKKQHGEFQRMDSVPRTTGDTMEDPFDIPGFPFQTEGSTLGFNDDYDAVCPYTGSVAPDVVYHFILEQETLLDIDLCGSAYDTKVYVQDQWGTILSCNDDAYFDEPCGRYVSRLETAILPVRQDLYIVIDGYGDASGDYLLEVSATGFQECNFDNYWWAERENEPPLGPDYVDDFNGGCDTSSENFTYLHYNEDESGVFIGKTGWINPDTPDRDWFSISTMDFTDFNELTITSSAPVTLYWLTPQDCNGLSIEATCTTNFCQPGTIEASSQNSSFSGWFLVVPTVYEPFGQGTGEFEYLLKYGDGGVTSCPLPKTADTGFGCPRLPQGSLAIRGRLMGFEDDYDNGNLDCLPQPAQGDDAVFEFYLAKGDNIHGMIQPTSTYQGFPDKNRSFTSYSIVDDLRMQPGSCYFGSYGLWNEHFTVTAPEAGFYYFVVDNDDWEFQNYGMKIFASSAIPEPPANNTCEGAETIPLGQIIFQDDLTAARNNFDSGYQCGMNSMGNSGIGDTGRDIVYRVDFIAGQELDLHMEGLGGWDEVLYLIGDCENPIGTCLAISSTEGTGVRLQYTAPKTHTAWLVCDSWGVGDRPFMLSGSHGFPVHDLAINKSLEVPSGLHCSPNPFNPMTRISFELAQEEQTRVEIYAIDGRRVNTISNELLPAGRHIFDWNGNDGNGRRMAAGTYFCSLSTPTQSARIKMVLLK